MRLKEFMKKDLTVKKKHPVLLTFIILEIALITMMIIREFFPFGDNSMMISDFATQYYPFMVNFRRMLLSGNGFFYAWNLGLGGDFYTIWAYYLSNPLNFLVAFVPEKNVLDFMTVYIILMIGLSGAGFSYYLTKHFKRKDYVTIVFGVAYGLCGFVAGYYWDLMWLGVIAISPIVILSLERLVQEKKMLRYSILLAFSMISNYYLTMHLCFFLCLYFVMLLILQKEHSVKEDLKRIGLFAGGSILSFCFAGFLMIPVVKGMLGTFYSSSPFPQSIQIYMSPLSVISRHFFGAEVTIRGNNPSIYCGILSLFLIVVFFCSKKIALKEKMVYGAAIILFFLAFEVNVVQYITHGMNYPTGFPARQAFLYVFLILSMTYKVFLQLMEEKDWKKLVLPFFVTFFLILICMLVVKETSGLYNEMYFMTYAIFLIEFGFLFLYFRKKKEMFLLLLGITMIGDSYLNMFTTGFKNQKRTDYLGYYEEVNDFLRIAKEDSDGQFFRVGFATSKGNNVGMLYNVNTDAIFSSTIPLICHNLCRKWGLFTTHVKYINIYGTPVFQMIISGKYYVSTNQYMENEHLRLLGKENILYANHEFVNGNIEPTESDYYLYSLDYDVPLGFSIYQDLGEEWFENSETTYEMENMLSNELVGQDIWREIPLAVEDLIAEREIEEDGIYYLYDRDELPTVLTIYVSYPDGQVDERMDLIYQNQEMIYLGELPKGSSIRAINTNYENLNPDAFEPVLLQLDQETTDFMDQALVRNVKISSFSQDEMSAQVKMEKDGYCVIALPAIEGWELFVDGEKRKIDKFAGCFLKTYLEKGSHEIAISYLTPGFLWGSVISAISICGALIGWGIGRKRLS